MSMIQEIQDKLDELEKSLEANLPHYQIHLRDIHKILQENPDQVTLLSEAQIRVIVSGLGKMRDVALVSAKKINDTKKLKSMTLDDF